MAKCTQYHWIPFRCLGHGISFVATAHELGLGKSTVRSIVYEGCRAIMDEFFAEAFPKPTRRTLEENAELFSRLWKYPGGAPQNSGSTYFNYEAYFSLVLLAIVNGGYRIVSFELGLFRTSPLKRLLEACHPLFPEGADLGGEGVVDYHVLADGGFPQRTWLQRPFMQTEIEMISPKLTSMNVSVRESSNVRMKFIIFQRALIGSPHNCKLLIAATLVLHNLLAQRLTPQQLLARYRPRISVSARRQNPRSQPSHDAQEQRMRMVRYFARDDL
ncbi:unnamed protein product [Nippostrongylus brasiliensis]|uniref:DDE Tnp4 domain-containing protein n=1 Tax=Nippostrongylus brasiliensis TaxID=27835 RepID=A0A0N4XLY6_NIPBR|nr:unnamed protein product [Nippostrongylus brasiliensis]